MAPSVAQEPSVSWPTQVQPKSTPSSGRPRNIDPINSLNFPSHLQPERYEIQGTHPESKILFTDVNILDSTGREPYHGDVLIEGTCKLCQRWLELLTLYQRRAHSGGGACCKQRRPYQRRSGSRVQRPGSNTHVGSGRRPRSLHLEWYAVLVTSPPRI